MVEIKECGQNRKKAVFDCPIRTGQKCEVLLKPWPINAPTWDWDGNEQEPTLTPSINCNGNGGCGWHGFMKAGKLIVA